MKKNQAERIQIASNLRREKIRQKVHQSILDAAKKLFLKHGYEGVSMRQVAEQVGYTPTTIYLYFEDKDDLLFAVVDQAFDIFAHDLQSAYDSTSDPILRLRALGYAYIRFGRQNPEAYQMIFMQRPDFLMKWKSGTKQPRGASLKILNQAMQQAQDAGTIPSADLNHQSDFMWAAVHGAVSLSIAMPRMFGVGNLDESFEAILDAALHGIGSQ